MNPCRDDATWDPGLPPLLDEKVLDLLARDIGEDGAIDVVRLFLGQAPRMLQRLERAAISRGPQLLHEIHRVAGAARNVGLARLARAASQIEQKLVGEEPGGEALAAVLDVLRCSVMRLAEWHSESRRAGTKVMPR